MLGGSLRAAHVFAESCTLFHEHLLPIGSCTDVSRRLRSHPSFFGGEGRQGDSKAERRFILVEMQKRQRSLGGFGEVRGRARLLGNKGKFVHPVDTVMNGFEL